MSFALNKQGQSISNKQTPHNKLEPGVTSKHPVCHLPVPCEPWLGTCRACGKCWAAQRGTGELQLSVPFLPSSAGDTGGVCWHSGVAETARERDAHHPALYASISSPSSVWLGGEARGCEVMLVRGTQHPPVPFFLTESKRIFYVLC